MCIVEAVIAASDYTVPWHENIDSLLALLESFASDLKCQMVTYHTSLAAADQHNSCAYLWRLVSISVQNLRVLIKCSINL